MEELEGLSLTVSVVIGSEVDIQSPEPTPLQDDSVLLEDCGKQEAEGGDWEGVRHTGWGTDGTGGGGRGEGEEGGGGDVEVPDRLQRFYFESDALVLKNNVDYQKLLKTLALLEAQKMQATKDLEQLVSVKVRAERDPTGFVTALKAGTLEPLPTRQQIADLPGINWKGYVDSVEKVVKQHSSVYLRTRRKPTSREAAATLTRMESAASSKPPKDETPKPPSYKQPWTPEEQMRLEELLTSHPPETVERRRYEKIATALGTRTPQQVASHVQKYFIKLAKAGLPVPGRVPNLAVYGPKTKKGGRLKRLSRPSTFFSTLVPRVFMSGERGEGSSTSSYSPTPLDEGEGDEEEEGEAEDEEEGEEEESSDSDDSMLAEWVPARSQGQHSSSSQLIPTVKCVSCQSVVSSGVYWECIDCPATHTTLLCPDCINSDHETLHHSPAHELTPRTLYSATGFTDQDYTHFSQSIQTKYNYLDPNFFPAS